MKPPANLALSVSRDRAAAGRGFARYVRIAGPAVPRFRASVPAARPRPDLRVDFATKVRLERSGMGEAAIVESLARAASGNRAPRPNLAETVRAQRTGAATTRPDARQREADRAAEEQRRIDGPWDAPALNTAELEKLARRYAQKHGVSIEVARLLVERGIR